MDQPLKSAMRKAPESSSDPNKLDEDEIDRSDPVAWEKAANVALTAAKRECEKHPKDEQRKRRYTTLKEDYKAAAKAKSEANAGAASKSSIPKKKSKPCNQFLETGSCQYGAKCRFSHEIVAAAPAVTEGDDEDWKCPTCELNIKVFEKDAHNKTRRHLKALNLQEKTTLVWRCIPCQVTIGASMRATHEAGKKHAYKVRDAKAGDWFCLCGQHNYSTKTICVNTNQSGNGVPCARKREFKGNIEIGASGVEWDASEHPAAAAEPEQEDDKVDQEETVAPTKKEKKKKKKDETANDDQEATVAPTKKEKKRKKKLKDEPANDDQDEEKASQPEKKKKKRDSDAK